MNREEVKKRKNANPRVLAEFLRALRVRTNQAKSTARKQAADRKAVR
jgi:hypothetical protein